MTPATPIDLPRPALPDADVAHVTRGFAALAAMCQGRRETPAEVRRLMAVRVRFPALWAASPRASRAG